ncbi:MAG: thiamine pyrophosphate-dependent dehydrogenase E1 component subunit alpha, partial [Candidatus Dadabacteria bacterium]
DPAPVALDGRATDDWLADLKTMLLIRVAEETIADLVLSDEAHCPCHLAIGQEAVAVGVSAALRSDDRVFGAHRSHPHYLALGAGVDELFAEVLGRATGASHGMGGSMHLYAGDHGFAGSVPIVAGTIPVAVGAALAAKLQKRDCIAVAYFGDGATEEGGFHEAMNFAANFELPVLFVCENNLYSSHLDIALRQPSDRIARFADANLMEARVVDGNNIGDVFRAAQDLVLRCRRGDGPAFLEAITYRWRGHVGPDENIDVGLRRKAEDLAAWRGHDPIARLRTALEQAGALDEAGFKDLEAEVRTCVQTAVERGRQAPWPAAEALLDTVYAEETS